MTRFTLFHGVAFADEAGLVRVGEAPRLAYGVATQTAHVVVGAELGIQILELLANATKLQNLTYIVVVGRHCIEHMQDSFKWDLRIIHPLTVCT